MATLKLDLSKATTAAEEALANKLLVAALIKDGAETARLLSDPTIKKLFARGVLTTHRTVLSFPGDPDLELS